MSPRIGRDQTGFIGQVADDELGKVFKHDITALGVKFNTPMRDGDPATARCLILVTPDGERTMNTFLGAVAASARHRRSRHGDLIESAAILYLEGYLWDPEDPRAAMEQGN